MARNNLNDYQEDRLDLNEPPYEYLTGVPLRQRMARIQRHYAGLHKNSRPAPGTEAEKVYLSGRG